MKNERIIFIAVVILAISMILTGCTQKASEPIEGVSSMIEEMLDGRAKQVQIPFITNTYGSFSMETAYDIQELLDIELEKIYGPKVAYKVAYASQAAMEQFGMDEPARGSFFAAQRIPAGSIIPSEEIMEIMLETEIAFTVGKRIDQHIEDVESLKPYVKWAHAAFDIGDFKFDASGPKGKPQDMIASGVGAWAFVLGPAVDPNSINIDALPIRLLRNGEVIRESNAKAVMGSPWNSLLWISNHIVKRGAALEPGQTIVTGTAAKAYRVKGDAIKGKYEADCGALGQVHLTIQ